MNLKRFLSLILLALLGLTACAGVVPETDALLSAREHIRLASIYESRGEFEAALTQYGYAARAGAPDPEVYLAMGNINLRMKRFKEAEPLYLKAIKLNSSDGRPYNNLAWLYMETDRLKEAGHFAMEALKRGNGQSYAYLDTLAVIQTRKGDFAGAERSFKEALALAERGGGDGGKAGLKRIYEHMLELYVKTGDGARAAAITERLKRDF